MGIDLNYMRWVASNMAMKDVIIDFENRIGQFKKKDPKFDDTKQKAILAILRGYYKETLEIQEELRIIDQRYVKMAEKANYYKSRLEENIKELNELKKENEQLKQNIK